MNLVEFGLYMKKLRKDKGLTISRLGELSGVSHPYISQIENGKLNNFPSPEVLIKLAKYLEVHYALLLKEAGHISKGALMVDGQLLVSNEEYDKAINKIGESDYEEEDEFFNLELDNFLQLPDISYKKYEITLRDRELIKMYLDALFADRIKE